MTTIKLLAIIEIVSFFAGCSIKKESKDFVRSDTAKASSIVAVENVLIPTDSSFRFFNLKKIPIENSKMRKGTELNDIQRKRWTDKFDFLKKIKPLYGAEFYSSQNKIGNVQPMIIEVLADDYSPFCLLTITSRGEVIDYLEIAGGFCAGPYDDKKTGETVWCDEKSAEFINDSTFTVSLQKSRSKDKDITNPDEDAPRTVDSLSFKYKITIEGKMQELKRDSFRVVKKMR
jgi:hypothetical protein